MRITPENQRQLLDLHQLDQDVARAWHQIQTDLGGDQLRDAAAKERKLRSEVVRLRTESEDLGRQAKRIVEDLRRVQVRAERNAEMMNSGVDARVQRELQHESESLERRQRELIEAERTVADRQVETAARADEQRALADTVKAQVATQRQEVEAAKSAGKERLEALRADRSRCAGELPPNLLATYESARADLGVGVAVLEGAHCSACRIDMPPGDVERLMAADPSEVDACDECGTLLLRP